MAYYDKDKPNDEAYEQAKKDLESGLALNFAHLGKIFGNNFWELLTMSLIDAKYSMLPEEIKKARKQ